MTKKIILIISLLFNFLYANIYQYETCILTPTNSFELKQEIKNIAYNFNKTLGLSKFFDTSKIVDSKWVKDEFQKDSTHSEKTVLTQDNKEISYSFFNRNSDTLILVGPGFTNSKEKMAPFAHMFLDYDIAILNFRGHGYSDSFRFSPLYHLTGIDSDIQLGASEENDVFAVMQELQLKKKYKKVIGLGICFGAFIFVKAQAIAQQQNIHLFDKLILDGCWLSLDASKEKIFKDPYLIISPQKGGAPNFVRNIFRNGKFKRTLEWCIEKLCNIQFAHISLQEYLKQTTVPTMFFYGKDDLMISRSEFNEIWDNLQSKEKIAIITNNPHVHNHLRSKELYKLCCELFIEQSYTDFINNISSPGDLKDYLSHEMQNRSTKNFTDVLKPVKVAQKSRFPYWTLLLIPAMIYGIKKILFSSNNNR